MRKRIRGLKCLLILSSFLFMFGCQIADSSFTGENISADVTVMTKASGSYPLTTGIIFGGQTAVKANTQIAYNEGSDQIYFIGEDNYVHALWWTGSAWSDAIFNTMPKVNNYGYGLSFANNKVFYMGADKYLTYLYWNGDWQYAKVPSGYFPGDTIVKNKSRFTTSKGGTYIYYIEGNSIFNGMEKTNGNAPDAYDPDSSDGSYIYSAGYGIADFLGYSYVNNNGLVYKFTPKWTHIDTGYLYRGIAAPIVADAPKVMGATTLATDSASTQLYYIAENGYLHAYWNDGSKWHVDWICSTVKAKSNSELLWKNDKLFFTDSGNSLRYVTWINEWLCSNPLYTGIRSGTGLAYGNSKLFFVDSNGKICYYKF